MKIIKQFNYAINKSYDIDARHQYWSDYRNEVTEFITSVDLDNKNVLVVGAGNLNDLDVSKTAVNSKSLTLLDIDSSSVIAGLNRQGQNTKEFKIIEQDLTALDNTDFFDKYKIALRNNELDSFFSGYLDYNLAYNLEKFHVIIVLPIYTQILFHQLMNIANNFLPNIDNETAEKIMSFAGSFLIRINNKLLDSLSEDGTLICMSDVLEYKEDSKEYTLLKSIVGNKEKTGEFYNSYLNTYGYSLGAYGLYDLKEKLDTIEKTFLLWEFDEERKMLVNAMILKKDK